MAFENVDVAKAKSAINSLINDLNYKKSSEIVSKYSNSKNFECGARDNFMSAINTLHDKKYKKLEAKLKKYKQVIASIEKYKTLSSNSKNYSSQVTTKTNEYNNLKKKDDEYKKNNQGNSAEAIQNRNRMTKLQTEINSLNSSISSNATDMKKLENSIKESI